MWEPCEASQKSALAILRLQQFYPISTPQTLFLGGLQLLQAEDDVFQTLR